MVQPNFLVYVATKGAIEQLCRVLAKDLGARGITVNTVSPGPVDTDMFRTGKTEEQIAFLTNLHPMKRIGQPKDVAGIVTFLAGPESDWINGQTITVNGVSDSLINQPPWLLTCNLRDIQSRVLYSGNFHFADHKPDNKSA